MDAGPLGMAFLNLQLTNMYQITRIGLKICIGNIWEQIEEALVGLRRFEFEVKVLKNPMEYDNWFDYIALEESLRNKERTREVYERAIANVPPADEKRYWDRYIYFW